MNSTEKKSYLVYSRARHLDVFRPGTLLLSPENPEDRSPCRPPWSIGKLREESPFVREIRFPSLDWSFPASGVGWAAGAGVVGVGTVESKGKHSAHAHLQGKGYQLEVFEPENFLNTEVLAQPNARPWLAKVLSVNGKFAELLKPQPKIWMVTGVYVIEDASYSFGSESSLLISGSISDPGLAATSGNPSGELVHAHAQFGKDSPMRGSETSAGPTVWAAQFRQLKVRHRSEKAKLQESLLQISLLPLPDLRNKSSMVRGPVPKEDDGIAEVLGVGEVLDGSFGASDSGNKDGGRVLEKADEEMTAEDWALYDEYLDYMDDDS